MKPLDLKNIRKVSVMGRNKSGKSLPPCVNGRGARKKSYSTKKHAEKVRLLMLPAIQNKYLRVYKCKRCKNFHLTSQRKK